MALEETSSFSGKPKRRLLTFEEKHTRKGKCATIHKKRVSSSGEVGIETCLCGDPTCKNCLLHRIKHAKDEFAWIPAHDYVIKIVSNVNTSTKAEIQDAYALNQITKENIESRNPQLSFGTDLTSKHVVCILPKTSEVLKDAPEIPFEDWITERVDWTHIIDGSESHEYLVMNHQKRLLSHKLNRTMPVKMCACVVDVNENLSKKHELSPEYHALHLQSTYENDEEAQKMLKAGIARKSKFVDARQALYSVSDQETNFEPMLLTFNDFLALRVNGEHVEEWEAYLGKFDSSRTQKFLKEIATHDSKFKWLKEILDSGQKLV